MLLTAAGIRRTTGAWDDPEPQAFEGLRQARQRTSLHFGFCGSLFVNLLFRARPSPVPPSSISPFQLLRFLVRQSAVPCSSLFGSPFVNLPLPTSAVPCSSICGSVLVPLQFPLHQSPPSNFCGSLFVNLRFRARPSPVLPSSFDIFRGMVVSRAKSFRGTWQIFQPPGKGIRAAAMTIGRVFCLLVAGLCMAAMGYAASYWYPLPAPGHATGGYRPPHR